MNSVGESLAYFGFKTLETLLRPLPIGLALVAGRAAGTLAYYVDLKHRTIVSANLKIAFAATKTPHELKQLSKEVFRNYGQNVVELLRLPQVDNRYNERYLHVEGRENIDEGVRRGKGVIILAMHFGSWEMASMSCARLGRPYKVVMKPQSKYDRLNDLLKKYRTSSGTGILERGKDTRALLRSLKNNEIISMVVDQGGKDGSLIPFFDRQASLADGAIRLALKYGTTLCFSYIYRDKGPHHRIVFTKPWVLKDTGNEQADVHANLCDFARMMEGVIRAHPAEYLWFYKVWKHAKETSTLVLSDGKTGHLRQSETVAGMITRAAAEKGGVNKAVTVQVRFRSLWASRCVALLSLVARNYLAQGRLGFLKWFLTPESFRDLTSVKADFVVSCGSSMAGLNCLIADDQQAKSIAILKPGLVDYERFDLLVLPQHDKPRPDRYPNIVVVKGAPNLITPEYLEQQEYLLLKRYSHLQRRDKTKIGVLLGGDTKDYILSEQTVRIVINQIREVAGELDADILLTTSRRSSAKVENAVQRELKRSDRCQLMIIANRNNVPEAVGGILGTADILVVSGDSISMVSEAASSGKGTVVFPVETRAKVLKLHKHQAFVEMLNAQGHIVSANAREVSRAIYNIARHKIKTRRLNDQDTILEAARRIV